MFIQRTFFEVPPISNFVKTLGDIQLGRPSSASQSSTYSYNVAENAIDDDLTTFSTTNSFWDKEVWYKMNFGAVFCFTEIVIINSHWNSFRYRMEDMKVLVVNLDTNKESLCGILKMKSEQSVHGQIYKIPCDMKCGDEVKLTVYHETGDYNQDACIHMYEIIPYFMPGQLKICD